MLGVVASKQLQKNDEFARLRNHMRQWKYINYFPMKSLLPLCHHNCETDTGRLCTGELHSRRISLAYFTHLAQFTADSCSLSEYLMCTQSTLWCWLTFRHDWHLRANDDTDNNMSHSSFDLSYYRIFYYEEHLESKRLRITVQTPNHYDLITQFYNGFTWRCQIIKNQQTSTYVLALCKLCKGKLWKAAKQIVERSKGS